VKLSYRVAKIEDIEAITKLSGLLYCGDYSDKKHEYDELFDSNKKYLTNPKMAMFLAFDKERAVGFSHVSFRNDYVEGTNGGPVGYLEGIYVSPDYRRLGIARTLCSMCEDWSREKGCVEFASDCIIENHDSLRFHLKIGFTEVNRFICFTKSL